MLLHHVNGLFRLGRRDPSLDLVKTAGTGRVGRFDEQHLRTTRPASTVLPRPTFVCDEQRDPRHAQRLPDRPEQPIPKGLKPGAGPALAEVLRPFVHRRIAESAELLVPAVSEGTVHVPLLPAQRQAYETASMTATRCGGHNG